MMHVILKMRMIGN